MQKIIIDTNVLVSSLIQRNFPFYIVDFLINGNNLQLCISDELFREYFEVLNREQFSRFPEFLNNARALLVDIESKATKFNPTIKLNIIKDFNDNKLLELAEISNADFLITGNTNDFTMDTYKTTKIVTPKQYWENHVPQ